MIGLRVIDPGYMSVQDAGRFGAQRYGLSPAGAMDLFSLAVANALLRQKAASAAVEIGPFPATLSVVGGPVRLALAGADRKILIDGDEAKLNTTLLVQEGTKVSLGATRLGMFSYLASEGGIDAPAQLGSLSVEVRASFGSPYPRPLREGDFIPLHAASLAHAEQYIALEAPPHAPIRVVLGPQDDYFYKETIESFLRCRWTVSPTSNRMSYRLDGEALAHAKGYNIVSDGIVMGHIQVSGAGQPLVMLADRGTTGGYPKIATIITADLGRFAQIPIGGGVTFEKVSVDEAQRVAREFSREMQALPSRVRTQNATISDSKLLLRLNLAGDAVDALADAAEQ
ncbi:Urea amidolyase related protein [Candidatus Filomicrobium marinum]|uniref:Urea amidolyase related protein n=2 Tax=Filomicrobium TaxID=119044 RepID=A0A0D6JF84_9HYPH|nr:MULTISPECIES: biotin-dependent carboxyltransferase family protein [Filomicrobium]MCV0370147.1 biotin-dependent carboxyltransferase family protein [Filomicrobium sp.]CFX25555.1 Urea amidolyase related protein [Candidatus Filomicrobium marinum]CPR19315.1 Urea amidolyase related protein [Candidatus Filomicrobium marinum]SDO08991.1 biotin-dependent carboxylase uncharacterized domain-containing protein [Filomicrobium insigne]